MQAQEPPTTQTENLPTTTPALLDPCESKAAVPAWPGTPDRAGLPIRQTGSARPRQCADSGSRGYDTYFPASFRLTGRTGRSPRHPPLGNPLDSLHPCKPGWSTLPARDWQPHQPGMHIASKARVQHGRLGTAPQPPALTVSPTAATGDALLLVRLPMWRAASGPARTPPRPTPDQGELQRPGPLPHSEEAVTSGDRPCQRAIAKRFAIS